MDMDPMNPDDFDLPGMGGLDLPDMDDLGGLDDPLDPGADPLADPIPGPLDDPIADPADDLGPGADPVPDPDPIDNGPADGPGADPADPADPAVDPADDAGDDEPAIDLPVDEDVDPVDEVDPIDPVDPVDPIDPIDPIEEVDPVDPVDDLDPTWAEFLTSHGLDPAEFEGDSLEEIVAQLEEHGIEVEPVAGHEHLLELVDQGHRILVVVIDPEDEAAPPVDPAAPADPAAPGAPAAPADPAVPAGPEAPVADREPDVGHLPNVPSGDLPSGPGGSLLDLDLPDMDAPDAPGGPGLGDGPGGPGSDLLPDGPLDGPGSTILEGIPSADGTSLEIETPDGPTSIPFPDIDPASFLKASAGSGGGLLDDGNIVLGATGVILIAGGALGLRRSRR